MDFIDLLGTNPTFHYIAAILDFKQLFMSFLPPHCIFKIIYFDTIGFRDLEVRYLEVKIKAVCRIEAKQMRKLLFMAPILLDPSWRPYTPWRKWQHYLPDCLCYTKR